jgi:hypothetical protein
MKSYGIYKLTIVNGMGTNLVLSSGYDLQKAQTRCLELNRVQKPKNTDRLRVYYHVFEDCRK